MISRAGFLAAAAAAAALPRTAFAQSEEYDPAVNASAQMLRVLLGPGTPVAAQSGFSLNGRAYRGTFTRLDNGAIVNIVSLEEYLYSVVPREMSPSWPAAALEAQAICARTYVLQRSNPHRAYDVVPSESDQVYSGIASESPAGRAAVDATAGQVLRYNNEFASIMYSSCCGGHTESPAYAWEGGANLAYLAGVVCPYCTQSPYYRWQHEISIADLTRAFPQAALLGTIDGVRVASADPSGRAVHVAIEGDRGRVEVKGGAFRSALGTRTIPSLLLTKTELEQATGTVRIEGAGLGHGVGLCQWGARGMALAGKNAQEIIALYFPGTGIGHD